MDDEKNDDNPGARHTDPWTSHAAARLRIGTSLHAALRVYAEAGDDGCTWDDLVAALHDEYAPSGIASIPNNLHRRGLIEETGSTRVSRYGRQNLVRVITEAGRAAVALADSDSA